MSEWMTLFSMICFSSITVIDILYMDIALVSEWL